MSSKIISITLFLIIFIKFGESNFNMTGTCTPCTNVSCPYSSCYLFQDNQGYSKQFCLQCSARKNYQFNVDLCQNDYFGTTCPRGVCYSENYEQDYCGDNFGLKICSKNSVKVRFTCGLCQIIPCQSPQCGTIRTPINFYTFCYNHSCSKFQNVSYDMTTCPNNKDYFDFNCTCCLNNPNVTVKISWCTDPLDQFDSNFSQYAKGRIAKQKNEANTTNAITTIYENLFSYFSLLILGIALLLIS